MGLIKLPEKSINFFKNNQDDIFNSGALAEGPWNTKLSEYVRDLIGAEDALPTNSNGAGLVALMSIYRHYYGRSNVMIQTNTMYGVKTMVNASGLKLSGYVNCCLETLMPSIQTVENAINGLTEKEKNQTIILLSHIGGIVNPDIESIASLCQEENIILLEDCAHSFGATLNNKHSGLFGNAGVYSFYATKAIPAGEGGIVVTNNSELGKMVRSYSIYDRFEQKLELGNNIRISELQALLAYSIVKEWQSIVNNKQKIADVYMKSCIQHNINYISQNENGQNGNYYKFIIYNSKEPIAKALKNLKTITSAVYDYSIGTPNHVAPYHACLPIWYGQKSDIANQVVKEINYSV